MRKTRGFSLIELIVSISIMVIIAGLLLAGYRRSGSNQGVEGVALDVSAALREAQVYSGSRRESSPGSGDFTRSYGFFVGILDPDYIVWVDLDGDGNITGNEIINFRVLPSDVNVTDFCGDDGVNLTCGLSQIKVIFPNGTLDSANIKMDGTLYQKGYIHLTTSFGKNQVIEVFSNGYVGIQ